jgi:hypothetical protein
MGVWSSNMGKSLDDLLGDEESEVAPVQDQAIETEETQPEPLLSVPDPAAQPRDESGRFAPKGVEESAPPAPKADQLPQEEFKALKEERSKRQTLEQQLAQLQQELQQIKTPPAPPPSVWEDEQGAFNHFGERVVQTAVHQASLNATLNMSEMMMRQANTDFDEMKDQFLKLAEANPTLRDQALADPHPWNKAYQIAKNHKTMQDLGATDLESMKAKLREELMAEMAAQVPANRQQIPPTLSTERNVGSRTGPAWSGPSSLSDLLS